MIDLFGKPRHLRQESVAARALGVRA
jgi:hypothetical protein